MQTVSCIKDTRERNWTDFPPLRKAGHFQTLKGWKSWSEILIFQYITDVHHRVALRANQGDVNCVSTNLSMQVYCQILPSKRNIGIMAAMKPLGRLVTFVSPSLPPYNVLTFWPHHRVDLRKEIAHTDTHSWGVVETKPCKTQDAGCCVDSV